MRERGGVVWGTFAIIGIVVMLLLLGVCAVVNDDDDEVESLGRIELVSHDYGGYECADHDGCGGYYEEDERDGGKQTCFMACYITIPPGDGGGERPQSLFPPSPEGIRDFVLSTIKGGIELGRLFAEGTIKFVESLLVGIA